MGGGQDIVARQARADQSLCQQKGDRDPGMAVAGDGDVASVRLHQCVQDDAVVVMIDPEHRLHRLSRKADLVAHHESTARMSTCDVDVLRDIGIVDVQAGVSSR